MVFLLQAGGGEKKEHLYKILVIGELGTGKTSIIKRYVHQFFSQHYRATVSFILVLGIGPKITVDYQLSESIIRIIINNTIRQYTYCSFGPGKVQT